ncbi:adenylate kinase [Sesbania bispinosa]|nr:adenylate kinase [Sesbania bispinosa]
MNTGQCDVNLENLMKNAVPYEEVTNAMLLGGYERSVVQCKEMAKITKAVPDQFLIPERVIMNAHRFVDDDALGLSDYERRERNPAF